MYFPSFKLIVQVHRFNLQACSTKVPNLPMQFLVPAEKGTYAYEWRRSS